MNINKVLSEFKEGIINSKKYWIIYMGLILISTLTIFDINNYSNPNLTNEWKDITNASAGKEAQIGFKVRR